VLTCISPFAFLSVHSPVTSLFGFIAVIAVLLWPFFSERKMMILGQSIGTGAFALHFLFLGSVTAAATSCLALVQLLAAPTTPGRWRLWMIYGASVIILAGLPVVTWGGLPSVLASIGSLLATGARLQRSTTLMRAGFLVSSPFWALHNIMVGSIFGLTVDMVSFASNSLALCRIARTHAMAKYEEDETARIL